MEEFERTERIFGKENIEKLLLKKVIIFGVGGVGGYVAEMLARTGIGHITLVDFDIVSKSNINRQIVALQSTIGQNKVDVMKQRILDINPTCNINIINGKLVKENIDEFNLRNYDYVADCIDMVESKVALIKYCYENNIDCLSAMGAGNKCEIPHFVIKDIFNTSYDGLAKVLRKKLREENVKNHNVVICEQESLNCNPIGSVVYYPAMCGCVLSAKIVKDLLNQNN